MHYAKNFDKCSPNFYGFFNQITVYIQQSAIE